MKVRIKNDKRYIDFIVITCYKEFYKSLSTPYFVKYIDIDIIKCNSLLALSQSLICDICPKFFLVPWRIGSLFFKNFSTHSVFS